MSKVKAVSNEEIIAAIMEHGTIKAAAESAGISQRAIYDRMNGDTEFIKAYRAAKGEILRAAVMSLNSKVSDAIETIAEIMQNRNEKAAVRIQAAQTIINNASRFADRLTALELEEKHEANKIIDLSYMDF